MPAGSIVIDLLMRTGSFETDTKRAEKRLKEMQKTAEKAGAAIGLGIVAGVGAAVVAFDQLNKSAGDFQDFAEEIGDTAENFASLAVGAGTAGVEMSSVAAASIKLSKGLAGVDDESKAAGAALKALNINIDDFKKLSPVEQYEAVGKALVSVADGQSQVAIATTLFGKAGAEQLRVFKALEESGGRQVILTQEQIRLADEYADSYNRSGTLIKLYAQAISTQLLPAYNDLMGVGLEVLQALLGIDKAGDTIKNNNSIKEFADDAAKAVAFLIDQVDLVVRLFELAGTGIAGAMAATAQAVQGNFKQALSISRELDKDLKAIIDRQTVGDKLAKRIEARRAAEANPASYSNEGRAPTKIPANFDGAAGKPKADKVSEAQKYAEQLRSQLESVLELTTVERLLADIQAGKLKTATDAELVALRSTAAQIDAQKALTVSRKADNDAVIEMNKRVQENYERNQALVQSVETPIERLRRELEAINVELQKNPFLTQETATRKATQAWNEYSDAVKKTNEETNTFAQQAADNIQGILGESVRAAWKGDLEGLVDLWKNAILRMASEAAAAQLGKTLLGADYGKTGNVGGLLGDIFKGLGGYFGGSTVGAVQQYGDIDGYADGGRPTVGAVSVVGERGPELFVPNTAGRVIPNDALGGGGDVTIVNPPGMPLNVQQHEVRNSDGRLGKRFVLSTILQDAATGGPAVKTYSTAFGAPRQLPRRGR